MMSVRALVTEKREMKREKRPRVSKQERTMNNYKQELIRYVRKKLETWLNEESIKQNELYRFLQSLSQTAAVIGLDRASDMAQSLIGQMNENDEKEWTKESIQEWLSPLISIFYYEEYPELNKIIEQKDGLCDNKLILLIDDDPSFIMFLKDVLGEIGWVVMAAADPGRALHSYYDLKPDCVIIATHIQDSNGLDLLVALKEGMRQQFVPTIIITRDLSKETRVKSYQLGADDYIPLPCEMDEFIVRINRQLERKQAIDDVMLLDELTRVYNRKHLQPSFEWVVSQFKRRKVVFSIALIDLDCFKQVNEKYGHAAGDHVLVTFASVVKNTLRQSDIVIRYGSDEFLLLLPGAKVKDAKQVLDRILLSFSQEKFADIRPSQSFQCTFSAGVHEIQESELDLKRNIEIVSQALYEAKQEGRNRVKIVPVNHIIYHQKRIHVGIVDDDPIIRTMLTDIIRKSKLTDDVLLDIEIFKDGMELFESNWYKEHAEPYLIILDGMMPRMDGIEVLQKLRELSFQERFTIMMLTSRKSDQDISRALLLGADDYMTKPFKPLELETRIGHLIKRMK